MTSSNRPAACRQRRGQSIKSSQAYLVLRPAKEGACPRVEQRVSPRHGGGRLLCDLVAQVLDQDLVAALVQHRKPVAGDEHGGGATAPLGVLRDKPRPNSALLSLQRAREPGTRESNPLQP